MKQGRTGNKFVVDFGEMNLPAEVANRFEIAVQKVALQTLAELDFEGDINLKIPEEWLGIWIEGKFIGVRAMGPG